MPRVIKANRGDLASRWGVVKVLEELGIGDVTIFYHGLEGLPETNYKKIKYGYLKNALPDISGIKSILDADINLWAVGLDIQDDSSLVKLIYLVFIFSIYKLLNIKNIILLQGAGPLNTKIGRFLAKLALKQVDYFVARDPGTYHLIDEIAPGLEKRLGHDAIFLPGFDEYRGLLTNHRTDHPLATNKELDIGINIRQWFHFSSSIIPYQFNKRVYKQKSKPKMDILIKQYCDLIEWLIQQFNANIILLSAYQPGIEPWEDDVYYLNKIKEKFSNNEKVRLMENSNNMESYFRTMESLDLMIGMRLHSSLIALRLGVPSINISYTLKGKDIMDHLGLHGTVIDLNDFISSTNKIKEMAANTILHLDDERLKVNATVDQAIKENIELLRAIL
ncbi:MAG: polysaccharide pyruvyl transferase family protein [Anaerolineales bacterium]